MPDFRYSAMSATGEEVEGVISAENAGEAQKQLRKKGLFVTKLEEGIFGPDNLEHSDKEGGESFAETSLPAFSQTTMTRQMLQGAFWCCVGIFVIAPVIATVYQFPIVVNGKVVGTEAIGLGVSEFLEEAVGAVWLTLLLFGLYGGFPALAILGAVGGAISIKRSSAPHDGVSGRTVAFALAADLLVALSLALAADQIAPSLVLRS